MIHDMDGRMGGVVRSGFLRCRAAAPVDMLCVNGKASRGAVMPAAAMRATLPTPTHVHVSLHLIATPSRFFFPCCIRFILNQIYLTLAEFIK